MERFVSGPKRNYYGKGDVIIYRLHRDGTAPPGVSPVFGAKVLMLTYGDAFWPTYTTGDNTGLVATDSMKNFIQRKTLEFAGDDLARYCRFLGASFLDCYPHAEGVQVSAARIPFAGDAGGVAFTPAGPDRAMARVELVGSDLVEATQGLHGLKLLRLNGSAFHGFVRDEFTTLPEITNRPLHMWLDVEWRFTNPADAFEGPTTDCVRTLVAEAFTSFESGSIQQLIHTMATRLLHALPAVGEVRLEANNRTWDTVVEQGDAVGIYTDARPAYGCLGVTLTR
ncbi:MAG TPA: urate oxidase [Vicinamibacterales bacterium]|nr:urate oxidase [Vicinamibacterales bacterium]